MLVQDTENPSLACPIARSQDPPPAAGLLTIKYFTFFFLNHCFNNSSSTFLQSPAPMLPLLLSRLAYTLLLDPPMAF